MKLLSALATALLVATACPGLAQDDADTPPDDATGPGVMAEPGLEPTDAETDLAGAADLADPSGPLAFGVVFSNGVKQSGTANWSSSFSSTFNRYEITISGESYYYTSYATVITPAGDNRFCRSSSVSGKLLVYCHDANGAAQPARFGFVTFKP